MSKNKRTPPPAASTSKPVEPPSLTERLRSVEDQIQGLEGAPSEPGEPSGDSAEPTAADLLKKAEGLLASARAHYEKAKGLEAEAKKEAERLAAQARDQEAALKAKKKAAELQVSEHERSAQADIDARRTHVEIQEKDLLAKQQAIDKRSAEVSRREDEVRARQADAAERVARVTEREHEAAQGFLAEKARILEPVEAELKRLRVERAKLDAEIAASRAKAEDDLRAAARARAEKWAAEDARRTVAEADARRAFDDAMARERQQKLDALRVMLASERATAESAWSGELERRTAALDARQSALDDRLTALNARQSALRAAELDLQAAQELLAEDRGALTRKVERLVAERTEDLRHEAAALRTQLDDARALRDTYFQDLESRRELDRRFGDRSPEDVLSALNAAERERDALAQQLRERPDARVGERLAELERERSAWLEERAVLMGDLARARGELATRRVAAIDLEGLRKEKEALEIHKQLLNGAVDELRIQVNELTRQEDRRNPMTSLVSIDDDEALREPVRTTKPLGASTPDLLQFAADLRHRIADGVPGRRLYYADRDVRAFLGGLAMTRLMLLQGISGTGKTSLPLAFASAVGAGVEVVEVQAGWRDRQDLVGYYNAFHRHYYATNFLQALYKAGTPAYQDRLFLMVLDEVNLSRPEQFFADFLSALEQPVESRRLTLVNDPVADAPRLMVDGRHLPIPPNVWFVGTANHDETTAEFADKTYDRAHVMELPRKTDAAHFDVQPKRERKPISYAQLELAFEAAAHTNRDAADRAVAWLRTGPLSHDLKPHRIGWGNRLEGQLKRYVPVVLACGGSIGEAMDHLVVTKVLRKLKDRHDVQREKLDAISERLQESWEGLDADNPPDRCVALLDEESAAKNVEGQG
jgi:hypothetical protein